MKSVLRLAVLAILSLSISAQENPYQTDQPFAPQGKLDEILATHWKKKGIEPARTCTDAAYLRRVYISLTGTLPPLGKVRAYLNSKDPNKREALVDELLRSPDFPLYFSLKWCDILRVKSEFPIKLWPNAVQAYHHWIWDSLRKNKPYDQFARELLTTSGSNFREPAVNFYRGTQNRTPAGFAQIAALCFLGSRIEKWPEQERKELEKVFARISMKRTSEWKEQVVFLNPAPVEATTATMPNGDVLKLDPNSDPRDVFAAWLTAKENIWFAQAAVNRCWFWLFGRGIVEQADDFQLAGNDAKGGFWKGGLRNTGNPAACRELLDYLAAAFITSGYDFRELCRTIVMSAAYRQSCIPQAEEAEANLAVYPIHRIDAEVLIDTFTNWGNLNTKYVSVIPEPFTFIPQEQRTIGLADGSISSAFLETFGRPARDTGRLDERKRQVTYSQRLYLLNSPEILWRVGNSQYVRAVMRTALGNPRKMVDGLYLLVLARHPTTDELASLTKRYPALTKDRLPKGKPARRAAFDAGRKLVWTLVNTKEFLYQH